MPLLNELMYSDNQLQILRAVYHRKQITRADLVEASGFKLLTVTKTVAAFIKDGILIEAEYEPSTGGRKAALLAINPNFCYTLAVDLGASGARVGVLGLDGAIIEWKQYFPQSSWIPAEHLSVEQLRECLVTLIEKYGRDRILGIGIGISGIVQHQQKRVVYCPNLAGWNDVDLIEALEKPLGVPVYVDTSARCMALAEYTQGAGQGEKNMVSLSIGSSISAGIILNGSIYRGIDGTAGELGHTIVDPNGLECTCGNKGCLEVFGTTPVIQRFARKRLATYTGYSILRELMPEDRTRPTVEELHQAAACGDKVATETLLQASDRIGTALSYVVNILNPQLVVLGGATIDQLPELPQMIERVIRQKSFAIAQQNLSVRNAKLGLPSAMIGSGLQVIDAFLKM